MRVILVAILWLAAGCMSADLKVDRPLGAPVREVSLKPEASDGMNDQQQGHMLTVLTSSLSKASVNVRDGAGVSSLVGKVERYSPGNKTLRWFFGFFGAGHGTLESTWRVVDGTGQEVGSCRVDGSIKAGGFGGSFDEVLKLAGERLAEFLSASK